MAAVIAKYVVAMMMMSCFTTGFALKCHECKGKFETKDHDCTLLRGTEAECNMEVLWGALEALKSGLAVYKMIPVELPSMAETMQQSNLACKTLIGVHVIKSGTKMIERTCAFKKIGTVDSCNYLRQVAGNLKPAADANATQIEALPAVQMEIVGFIEMEKCHLCYTALCNATNRLTSPAFCFIYSPLFLLVSIICKSLFR